MTAVIVKLHTRKKPRRPYWRQREETMLALWNDVAGEACVRALERDLPSALSDLDEATAARLRETW